MEKPISEAGSDLAQWAAAGDRAALERALTAAADLAHAQASRLLGRSADAADATQEALVQLVQCAHRYDPQRPFRAWLARLVHVACCRVLRSNRRRRRHEGAVPPPPTARRCAPPCWNCPKRCAPPWSCITSPDWTRPGPPPWASARASPPAAPATRPRSDF